MYQIVGEIFLLLTFFPTNVIVDFYHANPFDFRYDSLRIFDGDSNTSPMLGNPYCGDSLPPSQTSSSNTLFIYFYSNYQNSATGFKLEYNATSKNLYNIDSCTQNICYTKKSYLSWPFSKSLIS